jgi:hypothetical protein
MSSAERLERWEKQLHQRFDLTKLLTFFLVAFWQISGTQKIFSTTYLM